jgi:hypothetical protein
MTGKVFNSFQKASLKIREFFYSKFNLKESRGFYSKFKDHVNSVLRICSAQAYIPNGRGPPDR